LQEAAMRRTGIFCVPLPMFLFVLFTGCSEPTSTSIPFVTFESAHFIIYFEEKYFTLQEIERFAQKKERLYDYVTRALDVRYDGTIPVYLRSFISDSVAGYATYGGTIDESRAYVLDDDGHEIIHVIADQTLGDCRIKVVCEGLAMALELDLENENVIQRFVQDGMSLRIAQKLLGNTLSSSTSDYYAAGAFVRFIIDEWGMDRFKAFYSGTAGYTAPERLAGLFVDYFGTSISSAEQMFNNKYF
jgi:hypothetical protein